MILIRFVLVSLIFYLLVRSFKRYGKEEHTSVPRPEPDKRSKINSKKISKEIGEYVDYEDVNK
jgi:large-conductance mechanosensitive channel